MYCHYILDLFYHGLVLATVYTVPIPNC